MELSLSRYHKSHQTLHCHIVFSDFQKLSNSAQDLFCHLCTALDCISLRFLVRYFRLLADREVVGAGETWQMCRPHGGFASILVYGLRGGYHYMGIAYTPYFKPSSSSSTTYCSGGRVYARISVSCSHVFMSASTNCIYRTWLSAIVRYVVTRYYAARFEFDRKSLSSF
jgi:hypothetical protein